MAEPIRYRVDLSRRVQHLIHVTMTIPAEVASSARVVMPTWTPGSYVIRDYVHHVQSVAAHTHDGRPLDMEPDGHTAWRLPEIDGIVEIELEIYANELTVRTSHVDDHHALIIPPATFPFVDGATDRPHVVHLPAPAGESVWSLLPEGAGPDTHVASDYDHLVDSAFEVGDHPSVEFEVEGVPHRFVWTGHGGHPNLTSVADATAAMAGAAVELFGGDLPVDRYTFLAAGWDEGFGGLEHRDGSVLQAPVTAFTDREKLATFQTVVCHEYLHLWNVKRLVPADLLTLDYERPQHTSLLWVAEGWTAYYDELLPVRAGVWTVRQYLTKLAQATTGVLRTPGLARQSVRRSSHEAWTKLYVRDENSINAGISYYSHGALLAWCLDLLIRRADPAGDGIDAVLRALWERFGRTGTGYTEADVEAAVAEAADQDLSAFFRDHVDGTEPPPIEHLVSVVGLRFEDDTSSGTTPPDLGVQTSEDDQGVTFTAVLRDGPAWRAGLTGGDRLLAIDGLRVRRGELAAVLSGYQPGSRIEVSVFRGPRLLTLSVVLGERRPPQKLVAVDDPSDDQRTAFHRWTGRPLAEV